MKWWTDFQTSSVVLLLSSMVGVLQTERDLLASCGFGDFAHDLPEHFSPDFSCGYCLRSTALLPTCAVHWTASDVLVWLGAGLTHAPPREGDTGRTSTPVGGPARWLG